MLIFRNVDKQAYYEAWQAMQINYERSIRDGYSAGWDAAIHYMTKIKHSKEEQITPKV